MTQIYFTNTQDNTLTINYNGEDITNYKALEARMKREALSIAFSNSIEVCRASVKATRRYIANWYDSL